MFDFLKPNINLVNNEPVVGYVDDFLTDAECDRIIELAKPSFTRSYVMGSGNSSRQDEVDYRRTSSNTWLNHETLPDIKAIAQKVSDFIRIPVTHAEHMCVIEYQVGQEYQPHYDGFLIHTPSGMAACQSGHQRIFTVLMYLNTPEGGGETSFPNLETNLQATKGRAAFFSNVGQTLDELPPETLHGGSVVTAGVKYAATLWFHVRSRYERFEMPCEPPAMNPEWI